ncbi:MAG: Tex family protein [Anaerolineae bacterium]
MFVDFARTIAGELGVRPNQVTRSIELFDADNTVPFVARYRKEVTGGLDEAQLRTIRERLTYLRNLEARRATVLRSIEEQGKLTDELRARIGAATTLQEVEDLYLPYKPKRRTRATIARERGLEPLAELLLRQDPEPVDLEAAAAGYLSPDVPTVEEAWAGARDIVAETVAEDAGTRAAIRDLTAGTAWLVSQVADADKDARKIFETYYDYREKIGQVPPHRLLAINRGAREGILKVRLEVEAERMVGEIEGDWISQPDGPLAGQMREAIADSYRRLLGPAVERDVRGASSEEADDHAIENFGLNLENLLLQPPVRGKVVAGIDPGFRTGCKVAVVSPTGKFLEGATIYPHPPQKQWSQARQVLLEMMDRAGVEVLAIGNGTASRETEALAAEVIKAAGRGAYVIVNEAGASVYSASKLARQEFPGVEVSMRGAISIARRLQDPLAELVKIDPKSIGVGLYQHDVNQKRLSETLDNVVESVVNRVGVDVNTASPSLLSYVAGISLRLARAIVAHREAHGPFRRREDLRQVKGLGARTYEQAIGFLKIPDGDNPLDNTFIHPESYPVVERLFDYLGARGDEKDLAHRIDVLRRREDLGALAELLEVGQPTLVDILESLAKPGRDPRDDLPPPLLRSDVLGMEDLREGMVLKGTVRNVVDFGAFVDIGVKQDGLVHISQMADRYINSPHEVVSIGDVVQVKVLSVDAERGRIGLSMKGV